MAEREVGFEEIPMDFDSLAAAGSMAGSGGVIVLDDSRDMVWALNNINEFYAHESCGQCTPCREGTSWALRMISRIRHGRGRLKDLDLLLEIANSIGIMPGTTICGLVDGAAWPVKTAINKFRAELEDYIARTNPSGYKAVEPALAEK
jgi:NADH-quinone oxidoreductase subunit F